MAARLDYWMADDVGLAFYTDLLARGDNSLIELALDIASSALSTDCADVVSSLRPPWVIKPMLQGLGEQAASITAQGGRGK
ncbi:hypothetical protein NYA30BAC_01399 [Halomonas sp. NYA30]